jgi:hypothetical protein
MGELRQLKFSASIDTYVVIPVILLFLLFKGLIAAESMLLSDSLSSFFCGLVLRVLPWFCSLSFSVFRIP